jgi:hypothetical protein
MFKKYYVFDDLTIQFMLYILEYSRNHGKSEIGDLNDGIWSWDFTNIFIISFIATFVLTSVGNTKGIIKWVQMGQNHPF